MAARTESSRRGVHHCKGVPAVEYTYSNVQGRSYTSYDAILSAVRRCGRDLNLSSSFDELDLNSNNLAIVRGSGTETFSSEPIYSRPSFFTRFQNFASTRTMSGILGGDRNN